jgi:hypothetical protein
MFSETEGNPNCCREITDSDADNEPTYYHPTKDSRKKEVIFDQGQD